MKLKLVAGCALILTAGLALGWMSADRSPQSTPSQAATTGPAIPAEMPVYLAAVEKANTDSGPAKLKAGARPTLVAQGNRVTTMVIRDEGPTSWEAGNYRLVVNCAGSGTLYVYVKLGEASKMQEMPPCAAQVTTLDVDLQLPTGSTGLSVIIVPAGDAAAGVSYRIERLGR